MTFDLAGTPCINSHSIVSHQLCISCLSVIPLRERESSGLEIRSFLECRNGFFFLRLVTSCSLSTPKWIEYWLRLLYKNEGGRLESHSLKLKVSARDALLYYFEGVFYGFYFRKPILSRLIPWIQLLLL